MDFDLTDEQRLIRETARDFTDNEIVRSRARQRPQRTTSTSSSSRKIAAQGYLGAIVPREYGGAGLDYLTYGARRRGDRPRLLGDAHGDLGPDLARLLGDPEVGHRGAEAALPAEALLGRVARLLRPDRARHRLRRRQPEDARDARPTAAGSINGAKMWISLGNHAKVALIFAQTDPSLGPPRPRLLPRRHRPAGLQAAGRSTTRWACTAPTPPSIALDDVEVGRRRAARRGRRRLQGRDELARLAAATASPPAASGSARAALDESVRYAKERDAVRPPDRELPARAGDDRRHGRADRRRADARLAGRRT